MTQVSERSRPGCDDYRHAAVTLWGEAGAYAHDTYRAIRERFYTELPETLPIVIGLVAYGHCDALTRGGWSHGPRISLRSGVFGKGRRYVEDLLVHECLHAWLFVTGRFPKHAGDDWYEAVRRLSPAVLGQNLGELRRGQDRKSVRVPNPAWTPGSEAPKTLVRKERVSNVHAKVAGWPDSFRPAGYDWGAPIRCPTY